MQYAPEPTEAQLGGLAAALGANTEVSFERRILGGLGCTMDVLRLGERPGVGTSVILRRRGMWSEEDNLDAAAFELDVLRMLRSNGIPAPEPLWLDEKGVFNEPATLISFLDGIPLMSPDDPIDYTTQLALMLARLHNVSPGEKVRKGLRDYNGQEIKALADPEPPKYVAGHQLGPRLWEAMRSELASIEFESGVFIHGDYWPGNTLWQGQKLTAVVDFEEIGIGDPALDVATAIVNYKFEPWGNATENFLHVYRGETGRKLESLRFWSLKELRRPMPDIARWLPSFQEISSMPDITADELRGIHERLILETVDNTEGPAS